MSHWDKRNQDEGRERLKKLKEEGKITLTMVSMYLECNATYLGQFIRGKKNLSMEKYDKLIEVIENIEGLTTVSEDRDYTYRKYKEENKQGARR